MEDERKASRLEWRGRMRGSWRMRERQEDLRGSCWMSERQEDLRGSWRISERQEDFRGAGGCVKGK